MGEIMEIKLAPSMLAADFTRLGEQIRECETAGAPWLHIDVMDGIFVPNISFGTVAYEGLRKISNIFFDVHLMITEPERYIDRFIKSGADGVTFHIEATKKPDECIDIIKSAGKKADVVLPIYQGNGSNIKALGLQKRVATRRERLSFLKLFSAGIWGLMATSAINNFYFRKLICHVVIHFL